MDRREDKPDLRNAGQVDPGSDGETAQPDAEPQCDGEAPGGAVKAEWQVKTRFAINTQMLDVLQKTKEACEAELATLRRKVDKLTYGS